MALGSVAFLAAAHVAARDLWSEGDSAFALRTSLKATALVSRAPDDPLLYPERESAASLWRLRLEPEARLGKTVTVGVAYEQRLRTFSASAGLAGLGVLPPDTEAPYRIRPLDWSLASASGFAWRHEIDRACVSVHLKRAELTLGRQAIGWGRGVLFGAVDLFSPFAPLEADREWRRGVDAVRADVKLGDRASLDAVAAFGDSVDASTFGARLRGYRGPADFELVGGWRARDVFAGVTSSAALGPVEVHGELAVFRAPDALPAGGLGAEGRVALKAVAGGSYRVAIGKGLLVYAEYHYSGFGVKDPAQTVALLADPAFRERYLRGDTQILGRHALALLANYEVSPELALSTQWLLNPADGSGVVTPSATMTFGDKLSLLAAAYLPYGRAPTGLMLQSEYGAAALTGFLQLRVYD